MKTQKIILFLAVLLSSCTSIATETPIPTDVSSPVPFPGSTLLSATDIPTPLPTHPIILIITPDAVQAEKWMDYEGALAQAILPMFSIDLVRCEWDILGRSGQEVYIWAVCASYNMGDDSRPAVIHIGADGSIHSVEMAKRGSSSEFNRLFPEEIQAKFSLYTGDSSWNGRLKEMLDHLNYREAHPEEPPLIVLSATPTP
jgi:hypothetical protein